jgi:UDP-N-acetylglucosamine 2-epimerase (non-hydrolysing)/GDP/UDP-N,N'-diacetylbacillosamine 2-epimerase (hydrolysing)
VRTISVVTVGRSDYGIYLPVLRKIQAERDFRLHLIASGMHLSPEFGLTVKAIEADGFPISDRVEMLLSSDSPEGIAKAIGIGMIGFAQVYSRFRPDILIVLGDRFEMYAAALAALPFKIPVAHIHGGELTEGAIDDALRHSITKLSHLHFVATEEYARRVRQMGEEPWRVTVSGAPSLDLIQDMTFLSKEELESRFGLDLSCAPILATYNPVTMEYERTEWQTEQLLEALKGSGLPVVFTLPNSDTAGRVIVGMIREFVGTHPRARLVANLGTQGYFSLMRQAAMMVGNSSSGLIEALSFGLPVVNVGSRQRGRLRGENVIDVGYDATDILKAIQRAASPAFKSSLASVPNPYGDRHAAERIVRVLREVSLGDRLLMKRFHDL